MRAIARIMEPKTSSVEEGFMHPGMKMGYSRGHHEELGSLTSGNEMDFLCGKSSRKKEAG